MAGSSADDESRRLREREAAMVRHACAAASRTFAQLRRRHACAEVLRRQRWRLWKALSLRRCVQVLLWRIAATLLTPPACRMRHPQRTRVAPLQPRRTSMRGARCVVAAPRCVHIRRVAHALYGRGVAQQPAHPQVATHAAQKKAAPSLLSKLLATEIRRERSHLLQAFRFLSQNGCVTLRASSVRREFSRCTRPRLLAEGAS